MKSLSLPFKGRGGVGMGENNGFFWSVALNGAPSPSHPPP